MGKAKKHHYLSKFYLRWFTSDNKENCYYRDFNKKWTRNFWNIKNIAYKKNLFSNLDYKNWKEEYSPDLEEAFAKKEKKFSFLLNNIIQWYNKFKNTHNKYNLYNFSHSDRLIFIDLIKFQIFRSSVSNNNCKLNIKNYIEKLLKDNTFINKIWQNNINKYKKDKYLLNKIAHNWISEIWKPFSDKMLLNYILLNRWWYFIYINYKNRSFITSDSPIYRFNNNSSNWIINNNTYLIYPLSSKICLCITGIKDINENIILYNWWDLIKEINLMMLWNANNIIISSNKLLLEKMKKIKNSNSKKIFKKNLLNLSW